ncbi:NAD(P)-dependent oxidoreductase [Prochlorococcus sp. MIT 1300]|uniref:NAD(P)-dependent oxidoreductase n=1 Tax=Prochlorococcus sp. MIT 1300 TaxID=3096218 RepID=UPI002A754BF8|nr:NAD(P)-dependent oxidoreductase [Prochlorococcus sp. MIT 1300]
MSALRSLPQVSIIGIGSIGFPVALNLLKSGYSLNIYNRTKRGYINKAFKKENICETPRIVAERCEILIICVSNDSSVEDVLFGESGAIEGLARNSLVVDLSTISPKRCIQFYNILAEKRIGYIDAPVTGGTEAAKNGNLTILLGGDRNHVEYAMPVLKSIGKIVEHLGPIGTGQKAKAVNQVLVAGSYAALGEAIALGEKLSLPINSIVDILKHGAADSWALRNRSTNMINDDYPLGFKLKLHHKDLSIAIEAAREFGLELPITKAVKSIEEDLIDKGFGDMDLSVLKKGV